MGTSYLSRNNFPSERPLTSRIGKQTRPPLEFQKTPPEEPIEMAAIPVDRCITTAQAAVILGRSVETLKKWRLRDGKGPAFIRYPDGGIRYRLSEIMRFLESCTVSR